MASNSCFVIRTSLSVTSLAITGWAAAAPRYQGAQGGKKVEHLVDGTWVFVFPVYFHVVGGLTVLTGPGLERADGENAFIWRGGAAYSSERAFQPGATALKSTNGQP